MRNDNVCCNVCSCKHNLNGCECTLSKIKISDGNGDMHFCSSFEYDRPYNPDCNCGCQ